MIAHSGISVSGGRALLVALLGALLLVNLGCSKAVYEPKKILDKGGTLPCDVYIECGGSGRVTLEWDGRVVFDGYVPTSEKYVSPPTGVNFNLAQLFTTFGTHTLRVRSGNREEEKTIRLGPYMDLTKAPTILVDERTWFFCVIPSGEPLLMDLGPHRSPSL